MEYSFERDPEACEDEFDSVSYAIAIKRGDEIIAMTFDEEMAGTIVDALNKHTPNA